MSSATVLQCEAECVVCLEERPHLRMHDGVLVVLPDVVVEEDVLNSRVKGVDPERLPAMDGEGLSDPPGGDGQDGRVKKKKKEGHKET